MMTRLKIVSTTPLALAVCLSLSVITLAQEPCPLRAPVGEAGLRKQKATKTVQPVYPNESLKNRVTGKVIVEILVDENGKVPEARVKQAPDELTGQTVHDTAKQCEF